MGSELVGSALAQFSGVSGNAFKVLVRMAHRALDEPGKPEQGKEPRLYFAGWEFLALGLGHQVPNAADDEATKRRRKKLRQYVARAVAELEMSGAIKHLVDHPRAGTRQVYLLTLEPVWGAQDGASIGGPAEAESGATMGGPGGPSIGGPEGPLQWVLGDPVLGAPRSNEEQEGQTAGHTTDPGAQPQDAREGIYDCHPENTEDAGRFRSLPAALDRPHMSSSADPDQLARRALARSAAAAERQRQADAEHEDAVQMLTAAFDAEAI